MTVSIRSLALAATVCVAAPVALWFGGMAGGREAGLTVFGRLVELGPEPLPALALTAMPAAAPGAAEEAGTASDLAALVAGGPALVNLWATWCVPCVRELPSLDRFARSTGVRVVALSLDGGGVAAVRAFLAARPLPSLTIAVDPTMRALRELGGRGVPLTLLVDERGQVVARLEGAAEWDRAPLGDEVRAMLAR